MSKLSLYHDAFLDEMRQQTDPLADTAVAAMFRHPSGGHFRETVAALTTNDYDLPAGLPEEVAHFLQQTRRLPDWADERRRRQGHAFFTRHPAELLFMLGLLTLPYDYAAAAGVQVLYRSKRLHDSPGKRLAETAQYVLDVTARDAFGPKGRGICSAQKVRLIHAAIRYHIGQQEDWNPAWGNPVNQEDMAGTNVSLSLLPIRGLRKLDIRVEHDEMLDYVHLWNVASYVMGVDERLLPDTGKEAFWLSKSIRERQHHASEAGQAMMKSLLTYLQETIPGPLSQLAPAYLRYMLGDKIANILALPAASLPPALLTSPLKGLNSLRNLVGYTPDNYRETRQRLQQQVKRQRAESFKAPERLGTS